jgi:hypothetical protein
MMLQRISLIVTMPAVAVADNIVQLSLGTELRFFEVSAYLRALTTGPHTMRARRFKDNSVLGGFTFNAPGLQVATGLNEYMADDDALCYDITALGIGASELVIAAWALIPQTREE